MNLIYRIIFIFALKALLACAESDIEQTLETFQIEGKIAPPDPKPKDWYWSTRIYLDGGKRVAFLKVN